jgi:hypothetical protein
MVFFLPFEAEALPLPLAAVDGFLSALLEAEVAELDAEERRGRFRDEERAVEREG